MDRHERILTWALLTVLIVAVAGVVALALLPDPAGRTYTSFYILGPDGNASGYPTNLTVGEEATVIVGVENNEGQRVVYRVEVAWNESTVDQREFGLADEETAEYDVTVTAPGEPGVYRLRFLLYRSAVDADEPYRTAGLTVTVRP